jgi:radical SAM protein with 4Fe4S-binding SPASM domain
VSLPSGVLIELTSRCNLTCRMCPLTAGDTPSSRDPGNIDPAVWREVIAFAAAVGRANVGGYGEPLSNQKCLGYLRELDAAGVRISLTTNATMVNEKIAGELAAMRNLVNVNVSMDSPDPEIYRDIRGGELDPAMRGVGLLARAMGPDRVTVSSVLMRSNVQSLTAFPARLADIGVSSYVLQGLVDYTAGLEHEVIGWDNGLSGAVDAIRAAADKAGVRLILELPHRTTTSDLQVDAASAASTDTRQCFAPWDEPVVDKDGRVFPCCFAMTHGQAVLGHLKEETFGAVWHGRAYTDFRRAIVDGRTTPDICRQCTVVPSGPHLYREYAAAVVPDASRLEGAGPLRVVMRNTGTATWTRRDQVHIGTSDPRDRPSALWHPLWLGHNRVGTFVEAEVPPGATATFEIPLMPLQTPVAESFQLVVEHRGWLPDTRFTLKPAPVPHAIGSIAMPISPVRRLLQKVIGRSFLALVMVCAMAAPVAAQPAKSQVAKPQIAAQRLNMEQIAKTMDKTIDAHVQMTKRQIDPAARALIKADLEKQTEGLARSGFLMEAIEQRNQVFLKALDAGIAEAGPMTLGVYQMQRAMLFAKLVNVSIESEPTGAAVKLDGAPIGATNIVKKPFEPGKEYQLTFSLPGFETKSRPLWVSPGEDQSVKETLTPAGPGAPNLPPTTNEETDGSFPTLIVIGAVLAVIVLGFVLVRMGR